MGVCRGRMPAVAGDLAAARVMRSCGRRGGRWVAAAGIAWRRYGRGSWRCSLRRARSIRPRRRSEFRMERRGGCWSAGVWSARIASPTARRRPRTGSWNWSGRAGRAARAAREVGVQRAHRPGLARRHPQGRQHAGTSRWHGHRLHDRYALHISGDHNTTTGPAAAGRSATGTCRCRTGWRSPTGCSTGRR